MLREEKTSLESLRTIDQRRIEDQANWIKHLEMHQAKFQIEFLKIQLKLKVSIILS
jgi:hypothetical protein